MQKIIRLVILFVLLLGLNTAPVVMAQSKANSKEQLAKQKAKEKEKAAKEKEKAKAKAAKEKEKAKAAKEKERAKADALKDKEREQAAKDREKEKAQAERAKAQVAKEKEKAEAQAEKERALEEQQKQQAKAEEKALRQMERDAKPFEGHNYINVSARAGYAAMLDNLSQYPNEFANPADFNVATKRLTGGVGAGLQVGYELEYKHFLFETGLGFDWLNSSTHYAYQMDRQLTTYPQLYSYITDNVREMRNMAYVDLPVMFGAQFSDIYFLVGARVGYGLMGNYKHKGLYDITVYDQELLRPYGYGIIDAPEQKGKLDIEPLAVNVAAEIGLDLDRWLQADPDPKKRKVKPGERQPFGKEYIHYQVSLFAEYNVLNSYKAGDQVYPLQFDAHQVEPTGINTVLGTAGSAAKLNNLLVGVRFTAQFEIPGKTAVPMPAYAKFSVVDVETGEVLPASILNVVNTKNNRATVRDKVVKNGALKKTKMAPGEYQATVMAEYYEPATEFFRVDSAETTDVIVRLRHKPYFYVTVRNAETGAVMPVSVSVNKQGTDLAMYSLQTDSLEGTSRQLLSDSISYSIHIEHIGYEPYDAVVPSISDHMYVDLVPVKKGEVFIMKNMFFATNRTRILPTSENSLQELFEYLTRNPEIRIKIIGHTDNVGKDAANQKLSEGRATAVREDLIKRGIDAARIESEGRGETQPIDTNDTEEGRQNNRRVEVEVL